MEKQAIPAHTNEAAGVRGGRESLIIPEPEPKDVQNYREYSRIPSYQYSKMITLSRPSCLLIPI